MRRTNMKKPDSKREYESSMVKWGFWAKTAKMVSLRFFNPLISKHIKNNGIKNLFSKLGFYKMTF